MTQCPSCGLKYSDESFSRLPECPNCSHKLPEVAVTRGVAGQYFHELWNLLVHPAKFFRGMPLTGGIGRPLAFALVTHWLGAAVGHLWGLVIGRLFNLGSSLTSLFQLFGDVSDIDNPGRAAQYAELKDRIQHWVLGTGSVIADPFFTLFKILFTSFLVYLGARILVTPGKDGAPREVNYESAIRIVCFGMAPSILGALPLFGGWLSALLTAILTVVGAREVYRVGYGRASVIAFFPQVLFMSALGLFFGAMLLLFVKLVASI